MRAIAVSLFIVAFTAFASAENALEQTHREYEAMSALRGKVRLWMQITARDGEGSAEARYIADEQSYRCIRQFLNPQAMASLKSSPLAATLSGDEMKALEPYFYIYQSETGALLPEMLAEAEIIMRQNGSPFDPSKPHKGDQIVMQMPEGEILEISPATIESNSNDELVFSNDENPAPWRDLLRQCNPSR